MKAALEEAVYGLNHNHGGPFGAVIVRNEKIIAKAHNKVILMNDPTAHAEILAIRIASGKLRRFDLSDCELYSTCEPCPMCLGAIHWAKMRKLSFGCNRNDAANIGFDDRFIYDVIKGNAIKPQVKQRQIGRKQCLKTFRLWELKDDKVKY